MKIPYNILFKKYLGGDEENVLGFKEAGDTLVEFVAAGEKYAWHEAFLRPIGFLYRHYLELELKYWTTTLTKHTPNKGHSLEKLWCSLKPELEPFCTTEGDKTLLREVEEIVMDFHQYDPTGQEFRYTRMLSKTSIATLSSIPDVIDLKDFRCQIGKVNTFFAGLAQVLDT